MKRARRRSTAVETAGPEVGVLRRQKWDRPKVIAALRAVARSGLRGIGPGGGISGALAQQARELFGSLRAAVVAAGLDPARVLYRVHRTDRELAAELRQAARDSPEMTLSQLHRSSLGGAAIKRFGTLPAALAALGIRGWPRRLRSPLPEPGAVLAAIRRRHERGDSLRQRAVERAEPGIVTGAQKHFGTWRAAMKAAGLESLVGRPTWTKAQIVAGLRARHARGAALNMSIVEREEPSLAIAAVNHFGNMRKALLAAKLPVPPHLRTLRPLGVMSEQEFQLVLLRVLTDDEPAAARPGTKKRGS